MNDIIGQDIELMPVAIDHISEKAEEYLKKYYDSNKDIVRIRLCLEELLAAIAETHCKLSVQNHFNRHLFNLIKNLTHIVNASFGCLVYWNDQISRIDIYNRSAYNSRQAMQNSTYLLVQV